jgi:hypothetical protein
MAIADDDLPMDEASLAVVGTLLTVELAVAFVEAEGSSLADLLPFKFIVSIPFRVE